MIAKFKWWGINEQNKVQSHKKNKKIEAGVPHDDEFLCEANSDQIGIKSIEHQIQILIKEENNTKRTAQGDMIYVLSFLYIHTHTLISRCRCKSFLNWVFILFFQKVFSSVMSVLTINK